MSARFLVGMFVGILFVQLGIPALRLFVSYVRYQFAVRF